MKKLTVGKDYNNHYLIVYIDPMHMRNDDSKMESIYVNEKDFSKVKDVLLECGEWDVGEEDDAK